jgi:MYXO-CTERM domain-containing protein
LAWYEDLDQDGFGNANQAIYSCDEVTGYADQLGDCDDEDKTFNPDAAESCDDPVDHNCDGSVAYADADADGVPACLDCDDRNADALPGGVEVCDGADNDCNSNADDGASDAPTWFADADDDGYGDLNKTSSACNQPEGFVTDSTDCLDTEGGVNPGAAEDCATDLDDNCDTVVNEECDVVGDDTGDTGGGGKDTGCGNCSTAPDGTSAGLFALGLVGLLRRRRR